MTGTDCVSHDDISVWPCVSFCILCLVYILFLYFFPAAAARFIDLFLENTGFKDFTCKFWEDCYVSCHSLWINFLPLDSTELFRYSITKLHRRNHGDGSLDERQPWIIPAALWYLIFRLLPPRLLWTSSSLLENRRCHARWHQTHPL